MSGPGTSDRLTSRRAIVDRARSGEPEEAMLALLRIPFTDPDDPDLHRRARLLAELFERVEPARAALLYDRLEPTKQSDELSRLFRQKLHRATRARLLRILAAKRAAYRTASAPVPPPTATKRQASPRRPPSVTKKRDYILVGAEAVTRRSVYIDNIAETISRLLLFTNHRVTWSTDKGTNHYEIPPTRVDPGAKVHILDLYDPHASYDDAIAALATFRASNPDWRDWGTPVTFHWEVVRGERILLPTLFTGATTPNIIAGMAYYEQLYPLGAQIAGYTAMTKGFADFLNPVPFTEVTDEGGMKFAPPDSPDDLAMEALGLKGSMPKRVPKVPLSKGGASDAGDLPRATVVKDKKAKGASSGRPKLVATNMKLSGDTAGTGGIKEIRGERRKDKSLRFEMRGELLPPLKRGDAPQFEKDLPTGDEAGLPGTERSHLWGPGFGDEARDGITYAPKEVNQTLQNRGAERMLRELRALADKQGGAIELNVQAETYPPVKGHDPLKEVSYRFDLRHPDGMRERAAQIDISVPPPGSSGNVETRVIPGSAGIWSLQ